MAGDWIKLQHATHDKPEIMKIAKSLGISAESAFGHVTRVWVWLDQQSLDGHDLDVTEKDIDAQARHADVAKAMRQVGWLTGTDGAISFPNFARHNGESAKKRALAADRKREERAKTSRLERDGNVTREEERRGEIKETTTVGGKVVDLLPTNIPYKEIVTFFNENMGKLPMVREMTKKRRDLIRNAWTASKQRQSLKFWSAYFVECAEDDFLNGTGPYGKGHENWRPTFDYLLRNDVVTRVYEKAMQQAE